MVLHFSLWSRQRFSLLGGISAMWLAAVSVCAQTGGSTTTPCLQELAKQKTAVVAPEPKKPEAPGWLSQNAAKILSGAGALGGAVLGESLCKQKDRAGCMALGSLGGALLGSELGKALSEADKKRYQEATYKVALTGRPQSLAIETGCMVVEPASAEVFETREVEIALAPSVSAPDRLKSIAAPHVRQSAGAVMASPRTETVSQVPANVPSFVMGSTDSGKFLLLGREDADQGFVGSGYVESGGWVSSPDRTPQSPKVDAGTGRAKLVTVGTEVPCRQISSSIRSEASNKTETHAGKVCRLPNGISETS